MADIRLSLGTGASTGAGGKGVVCRSSLAMGFCGDVDSELSGSPDGLEPM